MDGICTWSGKYETAKTHKEEGFHKPFDNTGEVQDWVRVGRRTGFGTMS